MQFLRAVTHSPGVNIRERLEAFWRGEKPDRIPFTAYRRFFEDKLETPEFQRLIKRGFGLTWNLPMFRNIQRGVEAVTDERGDGTKRVALRTPVGAIHELYRKSPTANYLLDWREKHFLETAEDYKVMTWAVEHTSVEPAYDEFASLRGALHEWEIPLSWIGRTPLQTILVDYAGLENISVHLFEYEAEVRMLYEALRKQFRKRVEIAAEGPCTYVACLENFSAETLGPERYEEFLLPVYEECFPILRRAGKVVGCHYDGKTRAVREQIRRAPIDVIEAFTQPPEGDQSFAEARTVWLEKLLWSNLNVSLFEHPPVQIKAAIHQIIRDAAPDGRRLALECSEDRPPN